MWTVVLIVAAVAGLVVAVSVLSFLNLWVQAVATRVRVSIPDLLMVRLRGVDPHLLVGCLISLAKAGLPVPREEAEAHVLAGGHLAAVTDALIAADKAGLPVDFRQLAAVDLAGRDVVGAVVAHVNPKVLTCPPPESAAAAITGVCRDGIRLGVRARVTVRTRLDRLVGGAGEATIVARVGEGIVAAIGRADSHKQMLAHPELVSEYLLSHGLDSGTCFEILSVDVAGVDVEDNVGARLQAARAEADTQVAQAQAEIRRAAAMAVQQEMQAVTTGMRRHVVAARSTVPLAAAAALREANLGRRRCWPPTVDGRLLWRARAR